MPLLGRRGLENSPHLKVDETLDVSLIAILERYTASTQGIGHKLMLETPTLPPSLVTRKNYY